MGWATDDAEIELLRSLITKSDLLANKEKPVMNGAMVDTVTQEEYICDLIWKQSKMVFLSAESEDIVPVIQNGGWRCFCGTLGLTADEIIEGILEV